MCLRCMRKKEAWNEVPRESMKKDRNEGWEICNAPCPMRLHGGSAKAVHVLARHAKRIAPVPCHGGRVDGQ
ncbi:hypothetical protein HAX54_013958 [Datura stramonium]|uniref:Uncharacterized protein n=1 Tax=Datura stramonium TaxID=4076 RepID=A0ABS8TQ09_DATST|nr:hypothetical protein [Datura stramonium]